MELLDLKAVLNKNYGDFVSGMCLLQTYQKQPQKNGGYFIGGTLLSQTGGLSFKAWSNSSAYNTLSDRDFTGKVVNLSGKVNIYGGVCGLIVNDIELVSEELLNQLGLSVVDFMHRKYDIDKYMSNFETLLKSRLSDKCYSLFEGIFEEYQDTFKYEFAAISHHDNCVGGLLAHTLKVCKIATVLSLYPRLLQHISVDALFFGCAIHDIGKIVEYNNGTLSQEGTSVSHLVSGCEVLFKHKDLIVEEMGMDFYLSILSIVSCHHGEYGEPPRTVAAYVVHLLDKLESGLTGLSDKLEQSEGERVSYDSFVLS